MISVVACVVVVVSPDPRWVSNSDLSNDDTGDTLRNGEHTSESIDTLEKLWCQLLDGVSNALAMTRDFPIRATKWSV